MALTNSASTQASETDAPITLAEHSKQHDISAAHAMGNREPQMCAADSRHGEPRYVVAVEHVADLTPEIPTDQTQPFPVPSSTTFTPRRSTRSMKGQHTEM